uniref:Enoyl-CoA hydratase n=1 Tax=Arcella intermedia TaxID=1963864 RepID=A0A6B2LF29_9EUKA
MNLDFWTQLNDSLQRLEQDKNIKGVIFYSGLKRNVFTAGNDINELYAPKTSPERYKQFNFAVNTFLTNLYSSRLVTIAAIKGACPAGGCILSMCCDYRIMTEEGSIGLNEVALGIAVPKFWIDLMTKLVGQGQSEKLLKFAKMLTPREAKEVGLIDEVVATAEDLLPTTEKVLKQLISLPAAGRIVVKSHLRSAFTEKWRASVPEETETNWMVLSSPSTVKALGSVLERLSSKL